MSSIGGTLQRYQEWALPFLRNQISQNDLIMRVFVVAGANISEYTAASRQTILFAGRQKLEMKPQLQPEHCIHECVHQTWQNQRCVAPGYGKQFPRIKPALQESDCGTSGKVLDNNRLQKCCGVKNKATTPQPNKQGPCSTTAPAKASSMCTGGGERPEMKRPAQCFFCQAQAPVFVPNAFASSYTAPCAICRRYACAVCCEWELQKPYCTWCAQSTPHASVTALQAAARVRATAKRYQFWQESPDWMDYLEFVSLASLVQTAVPSHPPLRSSQPELVFDPKDMFEALLISKVQDTHRVKMLLEQNWVPEWDGWMELAVLPSEKKCVELVQRFLTVALANEQDRAQSNERRLQELEVHGWKLTQASPHGVNNCLIDSLLLGLLSLKILQLPGDVSTRRTVCAACRAYLVTQYGGSMGTFLDAHYDVVRILFFFLQITWQRSVQIKIHVHDRLNHGDFAADLHDELNAIVYEGMIPNRPVARHELHIFNHTDEVGAGYHFDLLWPPEMARVDMQRDGPEPATDGGDLSLVLRLGQNCLHEIGMQTTLIETLCASNLRRKYVAENVRLEESTMAQSMDTRAIVRQSLDALLESENSMPPTDADGLAMMKAAGFVRRRALAHGDNNSLIDALMLSLVALGLGVNEQNSSIEGRAKLAKVCRETLMDQRSRWETVQPSPTTEFDWWRDSPAILEYLMGLHDGRSAYNFVVHCADRHLLQAVTPKFNGTMTTPNSGGHRVDLYLYVHTTLTGREWHYDALIRTTQATAQHQSGEEGDADKKNPSQDAVPGHAGQYQTRRGGRNGNNMPSGDHAQERQVTLEVSADAGDSLATEILRHVPAASQVDGIEQTGTARGLQDTQDVMLQVLPSCPSPTAEPNHDHTSGIAALAGESDVGSHLQNFLNARSQTPIQVCPADVTLLRAKWNNMADVGAQVQIWLGASLMAFEPTRKNAHVLAKQWMRYYAACTKLTACPRKVTEPEADNKEMSPRQHTLSHRDPAGEDVAAATTMQEQMAADRARNKRLPPAKSSPKQKAAKQTALAADAAQNQTMTQTYAEAKKGFAKRVDEKLQGHTRPAPKRRYTKKAPQDMEDAVENGEPLERDEYALALWARAHGNPDPRADKEAAIRRLAELMRPQPTLPHGMETSDPAFDLPNWHCAFKDCPFEGETYADLIEHVLHQHATALRQVTDLNLPPLTWEEAGMDAYRAAISSACQDAAPLAHAAIDRRCLRQFQAAKDGDNIGAAICFVCAQRFPYVDTRQRTQGNRIQWRRLVNAKTDEFLNLPRAQVEEWFGYDAYWRNYAAQHEPEAQAQLEDELREWQTTIQFTTGPPFALYVVRRTKFAGCDVHLIPRAQCVKHPCVSFVGMVSRKKTRCPLQRSQTIC